MMRKTIVMLLCLLLLCIPVHYVFSSDGCVFGLNEPAPRNTVLRRGLIAGAETLLSNAFLMSFNIVVYNLSGGEMFTWATPSADSIRRNLTGRWQWEEDDGFFVNQIGHPYQGSVYFSAGRVNDFSFYQSVFFSAFGSFTWEIFFENHIASINDMLTTIPSSVSLGEMLYRLYVEASSAGVPAPVAFFINPMAGFHRLVTCWEPPDYGRNIYRLRYHVGAGYAQTSSSLPGGNGDLFSFRGFYANTGLSVIYGSPFLTEGWVPYNHFELDVSLGLDIGNFMDFRLISDGYLFSFAPVHSDKNRMSTGLSLHLDAIAVGRLDNFRLERTSSTINQYSNALNWTIKHQHLFSENLSFETKFHCGFTFFGASVFYSPDIMDELLKFGGGLNSKLFFNIEHRRLGRLETSVFGYILWSYPGTSAITRGTTYWLFADAAYLFPVSQRMSIGLSNSFALERGVFSNFPNLLKYNNAVNLFVAWNF